jgi:hypothetical protein
MAKRKPSTTTTKIVKVQPAPTATPIVKVSMPRAALGKARAYGKRARGIVVGAAKTEEHVMWALATAFVLGHFRKSGTAIPTLFGLSPEATVGLAAWIYGKMSKGSKNAQHIATGALCIVANQMGKGESLSGEGVVGQAYYAMPQQQPMYAYPGGAVVYGQ